MTGLVLRAGSRLFSQSVRASINKVFNSATNAIDSLESGQTLLAGGFGFSGVPNTLINALRDKPAIRNLTIVSNNAGMDGVGLGWKTISTLLSLIYIGQLLDTGQIGRMICSFIGENKTFERMYLQGKVDVELVPQGTIAEKCRAGGAGIPAFYTPAGFGTLGENQIANVLNNSVVQTGGLPIRYGKNGTVEKLSTPREVRVFDGRSYVMERAINADIAFVKAYRADAHGNAQFRFAGNNFNAAMGKNARITVVEADEIVDVGTIPPEHVHLPGIYVDRVIQSTEPRRIERLTVTLDTAEAQANQLAKLGADRERIVRRAAKEFRDGMYVNLGIGLPLLIPSLLPADVHVILQSENGILGLGKYPRPGEEEPDLINAGKETVTIGTGASLFGSEESFGMIRAGKLDLTVLRALQVSRYGDLANFMLPNKVKGIGGAMDLVANPQATKVLAIMEHEDKNGNPKIMELCTFPLTGMRCVARIITNLAVFDVDPIQGLNLVEIADESVTVQSIIDRTGAPFTVSPNLVTFVGEHIVE